jgi:periplasmic protein TonB
MDSPHSGFRRAAATSWALAGLGIAGVAGASALAYADTFKSEGTEAPIVVVQPAPSELGPTPVLDAPRPPVPVATANDPPLVTPETTIEQPPVTQETQPPEYSPRQTYEPQQTYEPAPAPMTRESKAPSAPPTTRRRNLTPATVMAPNYSPRVTMSHGS